MDENLKKIAKKYVEQIKDISHQWDHVERVFNLCKTIGRKEGADMEILLTAALFHDTGYIQGKENHEKRSAEISERELKKIGFDKEKIDKIKAVILEHRSSKKEKPTSLESKILQDADRLDCIGAMGLVRTFTYSGFNKRPIYDPKKRQKSDYDGYSETAINHVYEKLLKIKDRLNTETARKIAEQRHKFMENFLEEFFAEWSGKK